ncbi:MAG: PKD domain-containing protein [Bacteroidia bacterium]
MKIHVLFVLLIAVLFNSCNKKSLPPKDEEPLPVFYCKCDVGGFAVDIKAGVNGYYMKSSYYQDSNSVYAFRGELKQKDCSGDCGFGLTVIINDYQVSTNNTINIDSALAVGSYQYNDGVLAPLYYTGSFIPEAQSNPTVQAISYNWAFSDGWAWNTTNCTRSLKTNTNYTTSLTTNCQQFGVITHNNVYKVGNPVQTNVSAVRIYPFTAFYYKFSTTNLTGTAPFTYMWEFDDGYTSPDAAPTHEYLISKLYTAKLTVIDANNDTCISYYQVPAFSGAVGQSNFTANFTPVQNTKKLSTISIIVNDAKGNVYSLLANQADKNKFEIVSVENYQAADNNQAFKKVKIRFNCTVYNGTTPLEIKDAEAVIAIAYK